MKKILSLLLGIVLVLTLVGCHKDKTTTKQTTTEKVTTTVKTTTEQKTTVNPNVDPWYEDEYREIKEFCSDSQYVYERTDMLVTLKISETETRVIQLYAYEVLKENDNELCWKEWYYNPVQKKLKISYMHAISNNCEFDAETNKIKYAEFDHYIYGEGETVSWYTHDVYVDLSNETVTYLIYK